MEGKHCSKCKMEKPFEDFNKDKTKKNGLSSWCKICCKVYREEHQPHLAEINKIWRVENSEEIKTKEKKKREQDKEKDRKHRAENGDQKVKRALEGRSKITEKRCSRCEIVKPIECFSFNRQHADGAASWCKECTALNLQKERHKYLPKKRESSKITRALLRLEVLQHYSDVFPCCACCEEDTLEFLSIDHIRGGGSEHKRQVKNLYQWIKRNNFPEGFRILCHNCNQSRGAYGYCPHEREKEAKAA